MRNLVCAQVAQNPLLMRSIGQQVSDYRKLNNMSTKELAKRAGTRRQNIEQLEAAENRIPRYIGKLAVAMGVSVDEMMIEAGLSNKRHPSGTPPPIGGPLSDRLRQEREADPYELIERGLNALVVVGAAKEEILNAVRKYADIAAETQRALEERFRRQETKTGGPS